MTRLRGVFLASLLPLACGDDGGTDEGGDDAPATTAVTAGDDDGGATTAGDDDGGDTTAAPDDDGGTADDGGMMGPPVIESVAWTQAAGCVMNTGSDVTIVTTVSDPDNDVSELTFSGLVLGCTGDIDMPEVTVLCPQASPYQATITVADPDGNEDEIDITINPCEDGTAP